MKSNPPDFVIGIRKDACGLCTQRCEAQPSPDDSDAACPLGKWRKYNTDATASVNAASRLGLWSKTKHLTAALMRWQAAGFPKRSKAEVRACLAICHGCEFYRSKGNFHLGECQICGCTDFKPRWATEDCSQGKWPKLPPKDST